MHHRASCVGPRIVPRIVSALVFLVYQAGTNADFERENGRLIAPSWLGWSARGSRGGSRPYPYYKMAGVYCALFLFCSLFLFLILELFLFLFILCHVPCHRRRGSFHLTVTDG